MAIFGLPLHAAFALAAAVCAPVACLLALWFSARPEARDTLRFPMMILATLATASILAAFISGDRLVTDDPKLRLDPQVGAHEQYAARLILPTIGFFVLASLTGWVNPRTGVLRVALPMLLAGFSLVVLVLTVLSGDAEARSLWGEIFARF